MADSRPMIDITRTTGEKEESSYIVLLKEDVDMDAHFGALRPHLVGISEIKDNYEYLNAYLGTFSEETLNFLRASPDVEMIEEPYLSSSMADSAPTIDMARTTEGNKKETTTYIITLKKGVDKDAHFAALRPHLFDSEIKDVFKHLDAYSGTFSEATLDFLRAF
ncbi:hypothetical protein DFP72DRAFT_1046626 [Ephemerocybe angulata]|uniref:Inhibitor I9 domain-containing protein n=1 Tax=Ephemerocybe angulata TaxID=980116 RepID=A0A8H6HUN1_9AGAR|nr:hypothetical protein DFP72DRAFT_1046626 [Tulosesus angulatus]